MIVKGDKKQQQRSFTFYLIGFVLLVLLGLLVINKRHLKLNRNPNVGAIYCDAESVNGDFFINGNQKFGNAAQRSDKKAKSGNYSCLTDENNRYAFTFLLNDPVPRTTYRVTVWSYSKQENEKYIVAAGKSSDEFFTQGGEWVETDGNWWQKMEMYFTVPDKKMEFVKIYLTRKKTKDKIFFDDLLIEKVSRVGKRKPDQLFQSKMELYIDQDGQNKLDRLRKEAFAQGLLMQKPGDEIKVKLVKEDRSDVVKLRYKGDWLDHLMGDKPSYRIEMKSDVSWNGVQSFSVQHPKARGYLREWVFHELLKKEDVLTTRYDFIHLKINDGQPKVYAFEEHFNKNLVESQLRREGPIVRLTEDRFWEGMYRSIHQKRKLADLDNKLSALHSAEIKPYKEGKTAKMPHLNRQFQVAQELMHQYKYGLKSASEIFDLKRLAKYVAIVDITRAHHCLTWHNQRFYFNPVTNLLEPIAFDGFGPENPIDYANEAYAKNVYLNQDPFEEPLNRFFYDPVFVKVYLEELKRLSSDQYIKTFMTEIDSGLMERENLLKTEYPDYSYNRDELLDKARIIRVDLAPFSNSLQVFQDSLVGDSLYLSLHNAHCYPIFVSTSSSEGKQSFLASKTLVFPQKKGIVPRYTAFAVQKDVKQLEYGVPGITEVFKKSIPVWKKTGSVPPRQALNLKIADEGQTKPYLIEGNMILFERDSYLITDPLILPANYKVVVQPGCVFNFKDGGFLLSYSPVYFRGEKEDPIAFESLDDQSGSLTVLQAEERSELRHVLFKNQNTLNYQNWGLTGAVSFYESPVDIIHCAFVENKCEDALNTIRSEFTVSNCYFVKIYGDAFDADFCSGKVHFTSFKEVANDAVDFSTSVISLDNCQMVQIGDKGISAGEMATIDAESITITDADIACASKDQSVLTLNNLSLKNCHQGFAAYQKKPEFGPATIDLGTYSYEEVKYLFRIENGSILKNKNK